MNKFNVKKHGVIADGATLQTAEIQKVIDEASKTGAIVYFPRGHYVTGTLHLRNNSYILLHKKAVLLGSLNFDDFEPDEKVDYPLYQDASHSFFHCSMFVGENVKNITFNGKGKIDMRSVWDVDNVRNMAHRGAKAIALKECHDIAINGIGIYNATDLALYMAGCSLATITNLNMRVHIDGISPDNCNDVYIDGCDIECGDDGIVLKSSYTLNKLGKCEKIRVSNCSIKSRCNALKIGTETNGDFSNILFDGVQIRDTRIAGIALESVDGSNIDKVKFINISMKNVGSPIFVHLGKRMRGPKELEVGSIKNITFQNIIATGPYKPYKCIEWNYETFLKKSQKQFPGYYSGEEVMEDGTWQVTSNISGLAEKPLENIKFHNLYFELDGGVAEFDKEVPDELPAATKDPETGEIIPPVIEEGKKYVQSYPEVNMFGRTLPAKGYYFRHINGLTINYVVIKTRLPDSREMMVYDDVNELKTNTVYEM